MFVTTFWLSCLLLSTTGRSYQRNTVLADAQCDYSAFNIQNMYNISPFHDDGDMLKLISGQYQSDVVETKFHSHS